MVWGVLLGLAWQAPVRVPAHLLVAARADDFVQGDEMSAVNVLILGAAMTACVVLHVATMRLELMTSPL